MPLPLVPIALGGGTLALLLLGRKSGSSGAPPNNGPVPNNGNNTPKPNVFPAGKPVARVVVTTGEKGLNVRSDPNPALSNIVNSVSNGGLVAVLDSGFAEVGQPDSSPIEWWLVLPQFGPQGYLRAIGPAGESNLQPQSGTLPEPVGPVATAPPGPNPLPPPAFAGTATGQWLGGYPGYPGYGAPFAYPYPNLMQWEIMGRQRAAYASMGQRRPEFDQVGQCGAFGWGGYPGFAPGYSPAFAPYFGWGLNAPPDIVGRAPRHPYAGPRRAYR